MIKPVQERDVLDVHIDGVDDEGRGRGHDGELDVAVRGALPGDLVRCAIERVFAQRGLAQARALSILDDGGLHVARACPHPSPCAGCPLEGAEPGFSHALKRARLVRALAEAGVVADLAAAEALVGDVEPARSKRQKIKLTAGGQAGALRFGLFAPHSHTLVGAERCAHQLPALTEAVLRVQRALDASGLAPASVDPRGVKALIARAFVEGVGVVVVMGAPMSGENWRALVEEICAPSTPAGVEVAPGAALIPSIAVRVDEQPGNSLLGGELERFVGPQALTPLDGGPPTGVDAFCQPDAALAQHMAERVAEFLCGGSSSAAGTFADLYAGTGNFARALVAREAGGVTAVERAPSSFAALGALPVEGLGMSVLDALPILRKRAPLAGLVADPPKSGLGDAAQQIAALAAARVALVACDPDAGARDARVFVDAGYRVVSVEPLDLFPATPEIEALIFLALPP